MGSSKKKDKDRERKDKDRERKKRKRERSSSRSRTKDRKEKHHRHHRKHKKHKRTREERSPSISLSDLSDLEIGHTVQKTVEPVKYVPPPLPPPDLPPPEPVYAVSGEIYPPPSPPTFGNGAMPMQGGNEISFSIEETNRIRAKLGMKPLQVSDEVKKPEEVQQESEYKAGQEIHRPPENLRDKIQVEKLREKIAAQKEKRLQKEKMKKVKALGVSDDEGDNLSEWVKKSRKMEQARKAAEKKNKMLEELDAQFGIGNLVEEEITQTKKRLYNSQDLSGLRVQHNVDRFSEGQTTILTLKDSGILEGNEDTLVNVNIEDMERVETNLKRKKMKKDEVEYDAPEVDQYGNIVQSNVLTKYDEEIQGEAKKSFRIGKKGEGFDESEVGDLRTGGTTKRNKMVQLRREVASLETPAYQLATEYLTQEESVKFKKVKKKKKKKKMLTADDLEPLEDGEVHLGSRQVFRNFQEEQNMDWEDTGAKKEFEEKQMFSGKKVKTLRELMEEDEEEAPEKEKPEEEGKEAPDESEEEKEAIELHEALKRSRRAKQLEQASSEAVTDALVASNTTENRKPMSTAISQKDMTLNLTDEFCRSLGDIPTYGLSGNRAEDEAILLSDSPTKASGDSWDLRGGAWEEVGIETAKVEIACERNVPILEEEPDTGKGIVNALKLACKKGYLEKGGDKKPVNATLQHLRAVHYSIEDKTVEDDRRGGGRGGDRYMGPSIDFREKELYKPDVKLQYVDDEGRKLNAKEAFRYLSHKFHGKGSGKNKLEKRMKKWQEELLMKHMSSSDTPLQTLEKQKEKQKKLGAAYLVLSGSKTQETLDVKK